VCRIFGVGKVFDELKNRILKIHSDLTEKIQVFIPVPPKILDIILCIKANEDFE